MSSAAPELLHRLTQLHGREFAMLTDAERAVYRYFRARCRKFGVIVEAITTADPHELQGPGAEDVLALARTKLHIRCDVDSDDAGHRITFVSERRFKRQ